MSEQLEGVRVIIADHCERITQLFKPGALVSVVVRNPGFEDGDLFVTNDDSEKVVAAIRGLISRGKLRSPLSRQEQVEAALDRCWEAQFK